MTTRKPKPSPRGGKRPGAGRPPSEGEPITSRLPCTTTALEAAAVVDAAEREGITVSAWVRRAVRVALGL